MTKLILNIETSNIEDTEALSLLTNNHFLQT